jgi:DNA repair protein SbcC/Rad50
MIPTHLYIHNFMSYRRPVELDFRGIEVACLSGENGAGKSALLDAITWALWGKARVSSDRELIALREQTMEVVFRFLLNDAEYRVTRRRTGAGGGPLTLHLEVYDGTAWRPLSGDTVRHTQAVIIDLLRLDYDTFINSAFLLQGRAGEFTTKSPQQRKQVLGNILRLNEYDDYEQLARAELRRREESLRELDARLEQIEEQVGELPRIQADLAACSQDLVALVERLEELRARHAEAARRLAEIDRLTEQAALLVERRARLRREMDEARQLQTGIEERIAECRRTLTDRDAIERAYHELAELHDRESDYADRLSQREELIARRDEIQREIREKSRVLEDRIATFQARIADREAQIASVADLERRLRRFDEIAEEATRVDRERVSRQQQQDQLRGQRGELQATNTRLKEQMHELRDKLDQLAQESAICPICRRPLNREEREQLRRNCEIEGKELKSTFRQNQQRVKDIDGQISATADRIREAELRLRDLAKESREQAKLEQQLQAAKQAEAEIVTIRNEMAAVQRILDSGEHVGEETARLNKVEAELALVPYNREAHQTVRTRISELENAPRSYRELQQAEATLSALERERDSHRAMLERLQREATSLDGEIADLQKGQEAREEVCREEAELRAQVGQLENERSIAQARYGALEHELNHCLLLQERRDELVAERAQLGEEKFDYEHLALAFGKRGVQAMIIENVVPEIQDAANQILDRMPGNTMRLEFRTQREAVRGDSVIETLDIVISDDEGRRTYELYSGGEAFRIDFAVRVALSMLLTRRAGARLETLIIDEGFGSQDTRGRDGLLEAIRAIQPDFKMIIAITHIAELKDAFPTRIDVTKTPEGSLVTVN